MDQESISKDGGNKDWVQFPDDEDVKNRQKFPKQCDTEFISKSPVVQQSTSDFEVNSNAAVVDAVIEIVSSSSQSQSQRVNGHDVHLNNHNNSKPESNPNVSPGGRKLNNNSCSDTINNGNIACENAGNRCDSVAARSNSGFTNGDVIVSVLPVNTKWPWITPATFRPELVPEDLMFNVGRVCPPELGRVKVILHEDETLTVISVLKGSCEILHTVAITNSGYGYHKNRSRSLFSLIPLVKNLESIIKNHDAFRQGYQAFSNTSSINSSTTSDLPLVPSSTLSA